MLDVESQRSLWHFEGQYSQNLMVVTMVVSHKLEGSLVTLVASADDLQSGRAVLEELSLPRILGCCCH